jgi:hypothetical protein
MKLINIPEPPQKSSARNMAENLLIGLNQNLEARVKAHKEMFAAFWDSQDTPDDILAELNAAGGAGILLASAGENVDHIGRLAIFAGKNLEDFLPEADWKPRRAFIPTPQGITLAPPAEGFDAWGKEIPEVPAEPVVDPEVNP